MFVQKCDNIEGLIKVYHDYMQDAGINYESNDNIFVYNCFCFFFLIDILNMTELNGTKDPKTGKY